MMTIEDIKDMLYKKATAVFPGMPVYKDKHPTYKKKHVPERIVVNVLGMTNTPWSKGYANVNIFVPYDSNVNYPAPNSARMNELQKVAEKEFFKGYFEHEGNKGTYTIDELSTEEDPETDSFFVNVRLFFKVAHFKFR